MSSQDETASLLLGQPSLTGASSPANCSKPVLMRQECTTFLVSSHHPQLSVFSDSEEDGSLCLEENSTRSVPDIELHCRSNKQVSDLPWEVWLPIETEKLLTIVHIQVLF
ncbi:hypothetical protein JTB14_013979 [Gonioctena quinquepunctata]|nr:hypothetical protein JTB14_013979 [Gonioctena quinquepunctata]